MTYDELRANIEACKYDAVYLPVKPKLPKDHVFDDQKSVVWNREQVEAYNQKRLETLKANSKQQGVAYQLFRDDVIQFVQDEYNLTLNQARNVINRAWEDGHSAGYHEVLTYAASFGEFARSILDDKES